MKKLVDRMAKLKDEDQPEAYFHRFEETMKEAEIPTGEWPQHLRPPHWQDTSSLF